MSDEESSTIGDSDVSLTASETVGHVLVSDSAFAGARDWDALVRDAFQRFRLEALDEMEFQRKLFPEFFPDATPPPAVGPGTTTEGICT